MDTYQNIFFFIQFFINVIFVLFVRVICVLYLEADGKESERKEKNVLGMQIINILFVYLRWLRCTTCCFER